MGKLRPNLMGSAGNQFTLHQSEPLPGDENLVVGLAGFGAGLRGIRDKYPVLFCVFKEVTFFI